MKRFLLLLAFWASANASIAQCDDPNLWYHNDGASIYTHNLSTGVKTLRGSNSNYSALYDIAFAANGTLYGTVNDDNNQLIRLNNVSGQYNTYTTLTRTGSINIGRGANALTFLPDGTALIGTNSNGVNGGRGIYRVTISGNTYSYSLWYNMPSSNVRSGGDFILLGNKLFAAMWDGSQSVLYEFRVDNNYNRTGTIGTYTFSARMQGMAAVNGELYGNFNDGTLRKLTFNGSSVTSTNIRTGEGDVYGMTATGESQQIDIPVISGSNTICAATKPNTVLTSSRATGNQWYRNGTIISGATGRSYTATTAGSYTVQTNYGAGCTATSAPVTVIAQCAPKLISGIVWNDLNGDAVKDASEQGTNLSTTPVNGLWVNLVNNSGVIVASAPVGIDGAYELQTTGSGAHTIRISNTGIEEGTNISAAPTTIFELPAPYVHQGTNVGGTPNTGNTTGTISISNVTASITNLNFAVADPGSLPVVFSYVAASRSATGLLVKWATVSETNNSHFDIEASSDGNSFAKIGEVKSKALGGNTSTAIDYSFSANAGTLGLVAGIGLFLLGGVSFSPLRRIKYLYGSLLVAGLALSITSCSKSGGDAVSNDSNLFIRIAQVDKDGSKQYSQIIKVVRK